MISALSSAAGACDGTHVRHSVQKRSWKLGEWMEPEPVNDEAECIENQAGGENRDCCDESFGSPSNAQMVGFHVAAFREPQGMDKASLSKRPRLKRPRLKSY